MTTLQHLASWIAHCITRDDQGPFQDYAVNVLAEDQAYWEEHGWGKLYEQWLKTQDRWVSR